MGGKGSGRPPKPKAAEKRNPFEPPVHRGTPATPKTVKACPVAAAQWQTVCRLLDDMGILSTSDLYLVETFCLTYSVMLAALDDIRKRGLMIKGRRNSALLTFGKCTDTILRQISEMGLTPSARSKLQVASIKPVVDDDDPLMAIASRRLAREIERN